MADKPSTIGLDALETVTGGRYTNGTSQQVDPKLIEAIAKLGEAVKAVGQGKAQAEKEKFAPIMQFFMDQLKERFQGGGGKKK